MGISFDRIADRYDETRALPPDVMERVTAQILRLGRVTPDTHFFEPGIGTGRIALPLIQQGYAYTGTDISQPMMDKLRQKVEGYPYQLKLLEADATALPIETNSFDVAIASHILHLIPDWQKALDEIRRVLKPKGVFIYFHHPTNQAGISDSVSQQWHQILESYGYESHFVGAVTHDVLNHLTQQGASLESVMVAQISQTRSLAETLQTYQHRIYSNLWRVPDNIYPQALSDLQNWAAQQFQSLEVKIESRRSVRLTAAYNWAE